MELYTLGMRQMNEKRKYKQPAWYDKDKLIRVMYTSTETGWAVDLGDGTCRLANNPCAASDGDPASPRWGDRCTLVTRIDGPPPAQIGLPTIGAIVERYVPLDDLVEVRKTSLPMPKAPDVFSDALGPFAGYDFEGDKDW
jgi:hypothetical protein